MSKVLIIGIDGLDIELIKKHLDELPNFKKILKNSPHINFESVFPPDSPTAWTSIYTGKNPAEHGVVSFKDPFTPTKVCEYLGTDISGKTFWDIAGNAGKKVCVIFPHLGYPVWPVNGAMIGRTTEVDIREFDIQTFPVSLYNEYDMSGLQPMSSYPIKIGDIIEPTKKLILNETQLGLKLLRDIEWDLYFIYFSSLDNIEHLFWMYFDERDPEHPKNNPYKEVIPEFYKFYDKEVIGKFLQIIDNDTVLIVLSDHGHAMRPAKIVNINELFRRNGFLQSKIDNNKKLINIDYLLESFRKIALTAINEYRLVGKIASKVLKIFPRSLRSYNNITPIDIENTMAYLSDPSGGLKAYSYAGIKVRENKNYEKTCTDIINILSEITDPVTLDPILEWACMREEVYKGENLSKYPDILFKLRDDWGVGWELNGNIIGNSLSHKLHSGNHRQKTAVFIIYGNNYSNDKIDQNMELMDVAPLIFELLNIDYTS